MPRKASKTDQVLDLISGKDDDSKKDSKRKSLKAVEEKSNSDISDSLSELIQENLKKEMDKGSVAVPKKAAKPAKSAAKAAGGQAVSDNFTYVNVMESVVQSLVNKTVKDFDMCTCKRCMSDVTALTLTNLPAKYVVTDQQISPLLNYYSSKYNEIVKIELIKACTLIKQYPHHNR